MGRWHVAHERVDTPRDAAEILWEMRNGGQEKMVLLPLDEDRRVLPCGPILLHIGALDSSPVDSRAILRAVRLTGAKHIVLAHNHPSGDPSPSSPDIASTTALEKMFRDVGLPDMLVDHIILNGARFFSMRGEGMMSLDANTYQSDYERTKANRTLPVSVLGDFGASSGDYDSGRSAITDREDRREPLVSPQDAARQLSRVIASGQGEGVVVFGLDTKHQVVQLGVIDPAAWDPGRVVHDIASLPGVGRMIVAWHADRASGFEITSDQAADLQRIAQSAGVRLLDILRVSEDVGDEVVSYRENRMLQEGPGEYRADQGVAETTETAPEPAPSLLSLPDLVLLAEQLLDGRPLVKRRIRGNNVLGRFKHGPDGGTISLKADIFIGPQLADLLLPADEDKAAQLEEKLIETLLASHPDLTRENLVIRRTPAGRRTNVKVYKRDHDYVMRVLAHEIGHAGDWLDDKTMARGNILGHAAALTNYVKTMIQDSPQNPGELLSKEARRDIRRRAVQSVRNTTPLDPKKDADAFRAAVSRRYREMLDREAEARGLVSRNQVMAELKDLTQWWKPFDDAADPNYTRYRYSAAELYADAVSVLLNDPVQLRARAPKFYTLYTNWASARPKVLAAHKAITDAALAGTADADHVISLHEMFRRSDEMWRRLYEDRRTTAGDLWLMVKRGVSSRHASVADARRRALKAGADIDPDSDPMLAIENARYAAAELEGYTRRIKDGVLSRLVAAHVPLETFNEWLFHRRNTGDRRDLANPRGWTEEKSAARLAEMRRTFAPEQVQAIEDAWAEFWNIRRDTVVAWAERSGMYSDELLATMKDNEKYVTFSVQKYFDAEHGSGASGKIFGQIGTLEDVMSPLEATMMKDMALVRAMAWNSAKESVAAFYKAWLPDEITPSQTQWVKSDRTGKPGLRAVENNTRDTGQLVYMKSGRVVSFDVDAGLAKSFQMDTDADIQMAVRVAAVFGDIFRTMFIHAKPGYPFMNFIRDSLRTYVNAPGGWRAVPGVIAAQGKAIKTLWRMRSGETPEVIQQMLANGELLSRADRRDLKHFEYQTDRLMHQFHVRTPGVTVEGPAWYRFLTRLRWMVEAGNEFIERLNKVAGHIYLKQHFPEMSDQEIAHRVRTQMGSPDFLERGYATWVTNNMFLFSNAAVQGWKSDIEAMKNDRSVIMKRIAIFAPYKLASYSLRAGLVYAIAKKLYGGDDDEPPTPEEQARLDELKRWQYACQAIPENEWRNYMVVPLGYNEETRQALYLRLPYDETTRMMNGILHNTLDAFMGKGINRHDWGQILNFAADQLPTTNPIWEIGQASLEYITGRVHVDSWTNRPIMDERVYNARKFPEVHAGRELAKYLWKKAGLASFYNFTPDWKKDLPKEEGLAGLVQTIDTTPELAIVDDILGRFLKVSDYGAAQMARQEVTEPYEANRDRLSVVKAMLAQRWANGESFADVTPYEAQVLDLYGAEISDMAEEIRQNRGLNALQREWLRSPAMLKPEIERWAREHYPPRETSP